MFGSRRHMHMSTREENLGFLWFPEYDLDHSRNHWFYPSNIHGNDSVVCHWIEFIIIIPRFKKRED